jgi:hypothetical protein
MNLRGDATKAYFCPVTVIEAPKPVVRGPRVWPLGVKAYHALGDLGLIPEKSELLYDRCKLRAYAVAGVKECWLVLAPEKQIQVHRQPQGEQFAERALHGPSGSQNSATVPSFTVELDRLFTA